MGDRRSRRRRRRTGQREQGLTGDPGFLGPLVELLELRRQFHDASPVRFGLRRDLTLPLLQVRRHRAQGQVAAAHASRRAGVAVAVSTLAVRSRMAQYTLDSAEAGRRSW
ncbi:hypothetical protein [Streptomyces sp. NPDC001381]|uniref:hypothetical protein n=1 Tax=Streptomyces sp. NPDC001381 TaxID=3364567 RepID=UPI0036A0F183